MNKKRILKSLSAIVMSAGLLFTSAGCDAKTAQHVVTTVKNAVEQSKNNSSDNKGQDTNTNVSGQLKVSYIDVGQADSILIQQGDHNMLIDAGNNLDDKTVKAYLDKQGVKSLDYAIGTHPHEDHIGGLDYIINNVNVKKVYMPKATATTKTFKDVVAAIKNKGLTATEPKVSETFDLGEAKCTILAPNGTKYDDANNYSIVIKLKFGSNTFLFTGDAENISEKEMLDKGLDVSADVLKVGHHGSRSSTTEEFLNKVNPKYAVISCEKNNDYGHPHKTTIERLKDHKIPVYRTDESGSIVCTSDGKNITFDKKPGSYAYPSKAPAKQDSDAAETNN